MDSENNITHVNISLSEDKNKYVYKVNSKPIPGNDITIVLSKAQNNDDEYRIAKSSDWRVNYGECTCAIDQLKSVSILYLFLLKSEKIISNIVRIFTGPPKLKGFQLANSELLHLHFDTSASDHKYAQEVIIENIDTEAVVKLTLPECSVSLPKLGIWNDYGKAIKLTLTYYSERNGAVIYCLPLGNVTLSLFGPDITGVSMNDGKLTCNYESNFSGNMLAEIIHENRMVASKEISVTGGIFAWENIDNLNLDCTNAYTIRARFKEDYGLSLPGCEMPVILETPVLLEKRAIENGKTELIFNKIAQYEVTVGDDKKWIQSDRITVDGNACVTIRRALENSFGSALSSIDAKCFRYTSFKYKEQYFYMLGYKGAGKPTSAIETDIDVAFLAYNSVGAKVFSIKKEGTKRILAIDVSIIEKLTNSPEEVYDDFEAMLAASCSNNPDYVTELTQVVMDKAPLRTVDMLAFLYRRRVNSASVDLIPGMLLCVGDKQYQVIRRRGNVVFEPFVQAYSGVLSYVVPPFPRQDLDLMAVGGAEITDFLFEGLAAPFARLVYPIERLPHNSQGERQYYRNINIVAAPTLSAIAKATKALRERQYLKTDGIAYASMIERAAIIPKIAVYIGGALQWVSLGTTVGDIMDSFACETLELTRRACPVFGDISKIPLIMGDNLEVHYGSSK